MIQNSDAKWTYQGLFPGDLTPDPVRSSIRASLPGRAKRHFSNEVGSAPSGKPGYQTAKILEISVGIRIVFYTTT
jgi:hypothetical protein